MVDEQFLGYICEEAIEAHFQMLRDDSIESEQLSHPWNALFTIILRSCTTQFWFVMDAVEELEPTSRKEVVHHLNRIVQSDTVGRSRIFLTDRQTPKSQFSSQATLELGASESRDDVRAYIRQCIVELSDEVSIEPKLTAAIEDEIAMMANGTFLHALLAFANFTRGVTDWTPRIIRT